MIKPTKRIEGAHKDGIWCASWSKDHICTGSLDGTAKLWSDDLSPVSVSTPQKMGLTSVVLSRDGTSAVTCCQDSTISFLSLPDLSIRGSVEPGLLEAWTISISPSDDVVASGSHKGNVDIWSTRDYSKSSTLESGGDKLILGTAFSPDGSQLSAVGIDGRLCIFDIATSQIVHNIEAHALASRCVKYSKDGNLIFTASDDRHVCIFDARVKSPLNAFSHSGMALTLDTSADHRHFVVGCANHAVCYWDLGMQRCVQTFESSHTEQVWGVAFNETGDKFISVGDDALLQLYESTSSK